MTYLTTLCNRCAHQPQTHPGSPRPTTICQQCGDARAQLKPVLVTNSTTPHHPSAALRVIEALRTIYNCTGSWVNQLTLNERDHWEPRPTEDETPFEDAIWQANHPAPAFRALLDHPTDVVTDLIAHFRYHTCGQTPYGLPCDVCFEDETATNQAEDLIFAGSETEVDNALTTTARGLALFIA